MKVLKVLKVAWISVSSIMTILGGVGIWIELKDGTLRENYEYVKKNLK